jgi:hypothetical protein
MLFKVIGDDGDISNDGDDLKGEKDEEHITSRPTPANLL